VHVKLDTLALGRWGVTELPAPTREVWWRRLTHLATADTDPEFARVQLERFFPSTSRDRAGRAP